MKRISVGQYNSLYAIAENGLQDALVDLGINIDGKTIDNMLKDHTEIQKHSKKEGLPPSYFLYKKNANYVVNNILKELGIEIDEWIE